MTSRGRLSSLDLVPEEGQEDIRWAYAELNKRERTAADILNELNRRLVDKGLSDYLISKSAFNRRSVAIARAQNRIKMSRDIFSGIADHLTPENIDQANVALGEFIKGLISEIVSEAEGAGLSADDAMKLSRGFLAVVTAQKLSHDRKQASNREMADIANDAGKVARKAGLSAETIDALKAQILGIRKDRP